MARRRCAWRTRLIADGVRAPVPPRGVLAKFEDLYAADGERQAAKVAPPGATLDGIRVTETRAGALSQVGRPRQSNERIGSVVRQDTATRKWATRTRSSRGIEGVGQ